MNVWFGGLRIVCPAQFMLTESTNPVATYYAESNMCIKAKKIRLSCHEKLYLTDQIMQIQHFLTKQSPSSKVVSKYRLYGIAFSLINLSAYVHVVKLPVLACLV